MRNVSSLILVLTMLSMVSFSMIAWAAPEDEAPEQIPMNTEIQDQYVFVGTYTRSGSQGIYTFRLNSKTGKLKIVAATQVKDNPSYLAIHPNGQYLYAINEVNSYKGKPEGYASAFEIKEDGSLRYLNEVSVKSRGPCHISVDKTGSYVFVSNYVGGSVTVLPILADGRLGEVSDLLIYQSERGNNSHIHSVLVSPDNKWVLTGDLGLSKLISYEIDFQQGKLIEKNSKQLPPGSEPRDIVFHPSDSYVYTINGSPSTVSVFRYSNETKALEEVQNITTLPAGTKGNPFASDLNIDPAGRFLFGANQYHNSIVIYTIHPETKELSLVGHKSTGGKSPRNFALDVWGQYLLVANQDSNNIVVYPIDQTTGELGDQISNLSVIAPVCIVLLPISSEEVQD